MTSHPLWNESTPLPVAWKPPLGLSKAERGAEQDSAAGGRQARLIMLPGKRQAHASIALRVLRNGRRVYAYLRWSTDGKTQERYVGEVRQSDRQANLTQAWLMVREARLLELINDQVDRQVSSG